jgi:MoaA/NifB/PqqE/SkfB family radical SAM enzyme
MPLRDYCDIIDQIAPYAYRIELYNWGEPLLHPDIIEMIEYAHRKRISTGVSSNLNQLDAETAERLVRSGLSQLLVSIDGATQETYAAYRQGGSLETVLDNLRTLIEVRRALDSATPFIATRMLVGKHNESEVEATLRLVRDLGVDSFSTGMLFIDVTDPEQVERWMPENPAYSSYRHGPSDGDGVRAPAGGAAGETALRNEWACDELWESMVINWDGGVAPCCWLHDAQYDFGSTRREAIREIWNGPYYVSARRAIAAALGRRGTRDRRADVITICHRCRGHPHYMAY